MLGDGVTLEIFCGAFSYDKNPIKMPLAAKLVQKALFIELSY